MTVLEIVLTVAIYACIGFPILIGIAVLIYLHSTKGRTDSRGRDLGLWR